MYHFFTTPSIASYLSLVAIYVVCTVISLLIVWNGFDKHKILRGAILVIAQIISLLCRIAALISLIHLFSGGLHGWEWFGLLGYIILLIHHPVPLSADVEEDDENVAKKKS